MEVYEYCSKMPLKDWGKFLLNSVDGKQIKGQLFPGFQHIGKLGSATAKDAIDEAIRFYIQVHKALDTGGLKLTPDSKILDFGCGSGRILRCFCRDTIRDNLYGVDPVEEFLNPGREKAPCCHFSLIDQYPPTDFPDNMFDLVTAYSVYSHFSPPHGFNWIKELCRITKPGGMICITSFGMGHLNLVLDSPESELNVDRVHQRKLFTKHRHMKEFLGKGEFAFFPHYSKFEAGDWGYAFLPERFVRNLWCDDSLELVYHLDEYSQMEQAIFAFRKTGGESTGSGEIPEKTPDNNPTESVPARSPLKNLIRKVVGGLGG